MPSRRLLPVAAGAVLILAAGCTTTTTTDTPNGGDGSPRFGGTMTVAYKSDPKTFDPAVCYDATCWNNMRMLYDRLYDYVGDTMKLAPQAAKAMPKVSDDGLTYTITLRSGMTFSNGDPVRARDFVYSFSRILDPATKSPVQSFWKEVKGAKKYAKNPTGSVSGIKALSDTTLRITLTKPSSAFRYILAMPHASVIETGTGDEVATRPAGSGPFVFDSFTPGRSIKLHRNPHYWDKPRPYVDKVVEKLGVDPKVALLQLRKGKVDLMGDPIPPAQFLQVVNDASLKNQRLQITKPSTYFLTMNTRMKPFDDPKVRAAVSYAIDRASLIKLVNGQGKPANDFLPPGVTGHSKQQLTHDRDVRKAKKLLAEAGYPKGFDTTLYTWNDSPWTNLLPQIQRDLKQIGIDAKARPLQQSAFFSLASTPDKAPMTLTFWVADFPSGSDFYHALLACGSAIEGGQNYSFYCNKKVDDLVNQALAAPDTGQADKLYQQASETMLADNPLVPLYYGTKTEVYGRTVGGYHAQPIWGWDMTHYWKTTGSAERGK